MKKALKILGIILLCFLIVGNIARFVFRGYYENSFAIQVKKANEACPIPVALGSGSVSAIKLENGYLTYYLSLGKNSYSILASASDKYKKALLKSFFTLNAQGNNQGEELMKTLIKENCGVKVIIQSPGKQNVVCTATTQEIKDFHGKNKLNPQEAFHEILQLSLELEKGSLPMEMDEGMTMTDVYLEKDNVVYQIDIDEQLYSMSDIEANKTYAKEAVFEGALTDPETKSFFDMCKVSHTGVIYRYIGNRSHKKTDVLISSKEIRQRIQTSSNINIY